MNENDAPVELCFEVLRRLDAAGVLKDMVLVGSWCGYFYRDYFHQPNYSSGLRTRDMDFLIATPPRFTKEVDIRELLKYLGVNAQPIRFLNLLLEKKVKVRVGGIDVTMLHPVNFALQKLIISNRRKNLEKKAKDRKQAVEALRAVVRHGEGPSAKEEFESMPLKWRKVVLSALAAVDAADLGALFEGGTV